ncbi:MAG: FAD-binding oxidoreductase [Thermomicrobiales bacterium]
MADTDVVIIGGGISGTAAAYELARLGVKVVLVEQGDLASMASGWTLAGVRQSGREAPELPLAMAAVERWGYLTEELGADVEYRRNGNLRLILDEDARAATEERIAAERAIGLPVEYLQDNAAVREVAPALAEWIPGASFCPTDGHANPTAAVGAFAAAAQRLGAKIMTNTTVEGIEVVGGKVAGVRVPGGIIPADTVVVTAGIYSNSLTAPLGIDLPYELYRVSVIQTTPLPPLIEQVLGTSAADFAGRQQVDGRYRFTDGGARWPHELADLSDGYEPIMPTLQTIHNAITSATAVLPALQAARIARVWGGLLDVTPDEIPVIERVPEIEGLIVAAGFSGHGFCLGPVTGQIVRDLVVEGETPYPIEPFARGRFEGMEAKGTASPLG